MVRRLVLIGVAVVALVIAALAFTVFRTPESASRPIEAIPIASTAATEAPAATEVPAAVAEAPAAAEAPPAMEAPAPDQTPQIFEIVPAESEARFVIDEVLRGSPVTVVGTTDQVAGQIAIDPQNPAGAQVGTVQVNARALATDNDFRNRAIKNAILQTDAYEFVTFVPTSITGLPESVAAGEAYSFQMTGDLTVRDVTKPVTFDVTVTPVSVSELTGSASATILYRDFGLAIPDSPAVDTVADEVRLEIDFVARSSGAAGS